MFHVQTVQTYNIQPYVFVHVLVCACFMLCYICIHVYVLCLGAFLLRDIVEIETRAAAVN